MQHPYLSRADESIAQPMASTEETTPSYRVTVREQVGKQQLAYLEPASRDDLPTKGSLGWTFDWQGFWVRTDFDCEAIIKLSCLGRIWGLLRFGLYPFPYPNQSPEYLEILHLECVPKINRAINPVGSWLIWYAVHLSRQYCDGENDGTLVRLDSLEVSIPYYRDKIGMCPLGWIDLAPGEQGYAFRFKKEGAIAFCRRQESNYGIPNRL